LQQAAKRSEEIITGANNLSRGVDVAFIAMHGPYGEDGTIQGMLELSGVKYTGSKVLASALGMDKIKFRELLKGRSIPIPKYIVVKRGEKVRNLKELGRPPYFVKPYNLGSSVGASIARKKSELKNALRLAFEYGNIALVESVDMQRHTDNRAADLRHARGDGRHPHGTRSRYGHTARRYAERIHHGIGIGDFGFVFDGRTPAAEA